MRLSCFSHVLLCTTLWTVALQAPLSMGFCRQEYWRGLLFPFPGYLPDLGDWTHVSMSPALTGGFFMTAAAVKSLQSCPTLCDPIDGSRTGSPVPGILQARTLEWVAISFSNAWKWKVKVKSLSRVWLLATPWTAAYQAPLSMGFSRQEYWSALAPPILELIAQWKWVLTRIMESRATKGGVLLMEVVSFSFYIISTWFFYPEKFLDAGVAVFKHIILGCAEERVVLYSVFQNPIMRRDLCKLISKIFKS